jgi:hypothetical protein
MVKWLPEGARSDGEFGALNIANPLDNGVKEREWVDLSECDDFLLQQYLGRNRKRSSVTCSKPKDGEQAGRKHKRTSIYARNKHPRDDQDYIQITAPALLLVGAAAALTGYLLLRCGSGPERI